MSLPERIRWIFSFPHKLFYRAFFTKDAWGRIAKIVNENADNQEVSETTHTYSLEKNSITATKGSVSTTTRFDSLGNPVSVRRVDSNAGLGTQLWNATLGNLRVQGGLMAAGLSVYPYVRRCC